MDLSQHVTSHCVSGQKTCTALFWSWARTNGLQKTKIKLIDAFSSQFDVTTTEHWASFPRAEFGTKQNFKNMPNFAIPLVILTWNRMLQEYYLIDSETPSPAWEIIVSKRRGKKMHHMTICICQPMMVWSSKYRALLAFNQTRPWRVVLGYAPLSFNGRSIS